MVAHVILFQNTLFEGDHKHVFDAVSNLNRIGEGFNDETSSIAVLEGNWQFFKDWGWENPFPNILGPGLYPRITDALGAGSNDSITGLRPIDPVTLKADATAAHSTMKVE